MLAPLLLVAAAQAAAAVAWPIARAPRVATPPAPLAPLYRGLAPPRAALVPPRCCSPHSARALDAALPTPAAAHALRCCCGCSGGCYCRTAVPSCVAGRRPSRSAPSAARRPRRGALCLAGAVPLAAPGLAPSGACNRARDPCPFAR
nr:uncharacterized protein LOC109777977 [Aegilops tauschii subsp. strangulata]